MNEVLGQEPQQETGQTREPKKSKNFLEVNARRRELRQAIADLNATVVGSARGKLYEAQYAKPLKEVGDEAKEFKIDVHGGLRGAVAFLRDQKSEFDEQVLKDMDGIDYEVVFGDTKELREIIDIEKSISSLRNFRMRRMFESLDPKTRQVVKKSNAGVVSAINAQIEELEKDLQKYDPNTLRQAELVMYKQNLSESGHICITPSVEKYLDEIGNRMLTGKPMFLHGPTGTGKTSLARYAAKHFTGKDPEMVFCNPQTKESNVWGKTGIKPREGGAIETVEIYGPLAKAMIEGKSVIFDEFTALPKEQMVFIKGVFNAKVGDRINIVGNGIVEIKPGFQMIFTANLKSEKNPERQDLPPEIAREFEQNNLEVLYTPPDEAYDIVISRLMNKDGSLDMSYYDLNETLRKLCLVMADIQESYTNETNSETARLAGAMDASGKVNSLKKFVMTQGSVEAILSAWLIEKQLGTAKNSFAEFLDQRFKIALTFKEYSKEDRILVAKILASKGFLRTLTAKELGLPDEIFDLDTIKALRGKSAIDELKRESGDEKHLTLRDVALLDPFGKRQELLRDKANALLEGENNNEADDFSKEMRKKMGELYGEEKEDFESKISTTYTHPDGRVETIAIDIEKKLQDFISFYAKTKIDLPPDFEDTIRDIWTKNQDEIQKSVEQNGFDEILIIPGNIPLTVLKDKMKMKNGYYEGSNFTTGGSFAGAISANTDKPRIILVHRTKELTDRPELNQTLNTPGNAVRLDQALSLEDYMIFQRKYFEETGAHLDETKWTWLSTKSGVRLVNLSWRPDIRRLSVRADDLENQDDYLGVRPSRSFF